MEGDRQQALAMLADAERAGAQVSRNTPKEQVALYFWGVFLAVMIPGFDFFEPSVWGWVVIAVSVVGSLAQLAYFAAKGLKVRVAGKLGVAASVGLSIWTSLMGMVVVWFDDNITYAYTLAGVLASIPYLVLAERVRRAA